MMDRFVSSEFVLKHATAAWEIAGARTLRRDVFCREQRLFDGDDVDDVDGVAEVLVAIAHVMGMPDRVVGTVRIHESALHQWLGSRLAVASEYRRVATLGAALIRGAVGTARARGAARFLATVQPRNRALFERLAWTAIGDAIVAGVPHLLMEAALDAYAPCFEETFARVPTLRRAS